MTILAVALTGMSSTALKKVEAGNLGVGISTSAEEQSLKITSSGHSLEGFAKSIKNQEEILSTDIWSATNYDKEDIKSNTYTVQLGDTLWEIADGYYGDGSLFEKILQQNSSQIGYLPNGEQSLIYPDQILQL